MARHLEERKVSINDAMRHSPLWAFPQTLSMSAKVDQVSGKVASKLNLSSRKNTVKAGKAAMKAIPFFSPPPVSIKQYSTGQVHSRQDDLDLRWAKSRESYRRIASENYRSDSNH